MVRLGDQDTSGHVTDLSSCEDTRRHCAEDTREVHKMAVSVHKVAIFSRVPETPEILDRNANSWTSLVTAALHCGGTPQTFCVSLYFSEFEIIL